MVSQTVSQLREGNQQLRRQIAELQDELRTTRLRLEELDQLYHTAPVGLCLMDCDLRFVRINARLAAINGLPIKDHIGESLRGVLPAMADTIEPLYRQVIETGEPMLEMEVTGTTQAHPHEQGSYLVSYYPVKNGNNDVVGVSTVVQDVSATRHAEQQLHAQTELLEQIIATVPHSIFWKDRDSVYLGCNKRTAADLGLDHPSQIVGLTDFDTPVTRGQAQDYRAFDDRVMQSGRAALNIEETQRRPDGSEAFLLTSKVPLRDHDGEVSGVLGVYTDITSRKHAQQQLEESEARLRTIIDHAPEAIVVLDADTGRFVDANENAEQLFGLDRKTLLTTGPMEMSPPNQPDGIESSLLAETLINQTVAGNAPVFEWVHRNARGEDIRCEIRLVKLPYAGRNLLRGSITDITERIEAQQALQQAHDELEQRVAERTTELADSEERWRSLVQTAPDIILIVNPDGTIRYINRVEPGYQVEHVIGTSAFDYVISDDRQSMRRRYENVLSSGEIESFEVRVERPEGIVTYSSRVGPFFENGMITGVTSIATDISEQKAAEAKLMAEDQVLRQLLDLQETERKMLAYDIHDGFVQDVVGAQMRVEGARYLDDLGTVKNELESVAEVLRNGISEGRRLIRELRPMVLDEAGVVEAIRHLVADERKYETLDVDFVYDVQFDRLEPMLEGAIFRIVQESLNNVKRHAGTTKAKVELAQGNGTLHMKIEDEGCGFDQKHVPHDRFGLRGMQERARLFGGAAKIRSAPGQGTLVSVELPVDATSPITTN
ncbi:MAG: PAS domain-containing protein [Pirellulales bacterium]|nr:PAS domain-containing protein [Pirellulales bacterium]